MEALINEFLKTGYGDGYGDGSGDGSGYGDGYGDGYGSGDGDGSGDGSGSGDGDGYGDGSGDGSGSGDGYGDGSGYGDGYGDGLKSINNKQVYIIDDTPTIFYSVKGNVAKCAIVNNDLTLSDCYVAKINDFFAHGETIQKAIESAELKYLDNTPIEEKISMFKEKFNLIDSYPATDFFKWHGILTGSCEFGRKNFCENNNIDFENSKFTVKEFIDITINQYNSSVIKELKTKLLD